MKPYPHWVCEACGMRAAIVSNTSINNIACWHQDVCEVCRMYTNVTEARDYGYPNFEGHDNVGINEFEKKIAQPNDKAIDDKLAKAVIAFLRSRRISIKIRDNKFWLDGFCMTQYQDYLELEVKIRMERR
jgi:hypothetical protein